MYESLILFVGANVRVKLKFPGSKEVLIALINILKNAFRYIYWDVSVGKGYPRTPFGFHEQ